MRFVALLLILFPSSLLAQLNEEVRRAMNRYDYETVISLITPETSDSVLAVTKIQALKAMNRYTEAITNLNILLGCDSTDIKTLVDLAECYKLINNPHRAAGCYERALKIQSENKYFWIQYIRTLLTAENFEGARTACHGWLERDTCSATPYRFLGQAYEGLQDPTAAFFSYNIAYRRDSLDDQTVARLASIFNDNNQFADAVSVTEKYRLTDTTSINVNRQNAKAYCMLHDYRKAKERYESLKLMGDRSFTTCYYLGMSCYFSGWIYEACDNLKEANLKSPTDVNVLYYLAEACARSSWKKEAVEYMEEAFNLAVPSDSLMVRLYEGLAYCYGHNKQTDKEIDALKKLYDYSKSNRTLYNIGLRYEWAKDIKNATLYYEKYMATISEKERYALDENGNVATDRITLYQDAQKRIKYMKTEAFFKEGYEVTPIKRNQSEASM